MRAAIPIGVIGIGALVALAGCGPSAAEKLRAALATCERASDFCSQNPCPQTIAAPVADALTGLRAPAPDDAAVRSASETCQGAIRWMAGSR